MSGEVIERLPFEKYRDVSGVHSTGLKHMLVSPLEYQWRETQPRDDTDTLRTGRAAHTAILEPERFLREYVECPVDEEGKAKRRFGKAWDEFQLLNAGKTCLLPKQFKLALTLRDVVRDHSVAGPLVKGIGRNELTLRWKHARTGIDCKGRIDRLAKSTLIDVKTCRDPSPHAFAASAARLGYALQAAFYHDGANECGLGVTHVKIIAVQSSEPHDVVVYDLETEIIDLGRQQYEQAIDKVIECREKQNWPGQATDMAVSLKLPVWATPGTEDDLTFGGESIF